MENNTKKEMETKVIFKPYISKGLIARGNRVIDIKPDKNNRDKTLLVFEVTEKFKKDLEEIVATKKKEREEKAPKVNTYNCYDKNLYKKLIDGGCTLITKCKNIKTDKIMSVFLRDETLENILSTKTQEKNK